MALFRDINLAREGRRSKSMATSLISIEVDEDTANAYSEASEEEQRKPQILLNLRLKEIVNEPRKSLKQVMDEIGAEAQARGLTPEILESLLRDEPDRLTF
jgi:hypothetical protein